NNFFNQLEYQSDLVVWGKEDYWATPDEFLEKGAGDCEDFAIAKYMTLRQLNISQEKLLICYMKMQKPEKTCDLPHILLTYTQSPQSVPLVLDNFKKAILPLNERTDLTPLYCFNEEGFWEMKEAGQKKYLGRSITLEKWQAVEKRAKHPLHEAH